MDNSTVSTVPPSPLVSDYLEVVFLVCMFLVGAPLNLAAYTQLMEKGLSSRLDHLKLHLNYTDLLVVLIFVPSRALWLLTYDWRGGDVLCKAVKFSHSLAFQASSNVIVVIAVDRLLCVLCWSSHVGALKRTRLLLLLAWASALIISLPQLHLWRAYLAFPSLEWYQCLQMWEIDRHEMEMAGGSPPVMLPHETIYSLLHLCLVFWIPLTTIAMCYMVVLWWVWLNSGVGTPALPRPSTHRGSAAPPTALTNTDTAAETAFMNESCQIPATAPIYCNKPQILLSERVENERPIIEQRPHFGNSQSYHARITRSRAMRLSVVLVVAYVICWLPYNVISLLNLMHPMASTWTSKVYWLHGLVVFNSVVNPYLYGLFGPPFLRLS